MSVAEHYARFSRLHSQVGRHDLPAALVLERFDELASLLGPQALARQQHWESVFEPLCAIESALYPCLIRNLTSVEFLSSGEARQLASTLRQLRLGHDNYLRALPLSGVDTKQERISADWLRTALIDGAIGRIRSALERVAKLSAALHVRSRGTAGNRRRNMFTSGKQPVHPFYDRRFE